MITRKQIELAQISGGQDSMRVRTDSIMRLINEERNQYQELVEAAVMWHKFMDHNDRNHEMTAGIPKGLADAVKPFIKLSLSEKITKLSDMDIPTVVSLTLKELAEEAKTLEQELELR